VPFPIQVVDKIQVIDNLTGSKSTVRHAYHEGHYDTYARKFRGFAYIEFHSDNSRFHCH
jgi:hypothetical protein